MSSSIWVGDDMMSSNRARLDAWIGMPIVSTPSRRTLYDNHHSQLLSTVALVEDYRRGSGEYSPHGLNRVAVDDLLV